MAAVLDPYTTTRKEYTDVLLGNHMKPGAPQWMVTMADNLADLYQRLAYHPAMTQTGNNEQTFKTPAASKNKIYFMWDFVGRTLTMAYMFVPTGDASDKEKRFDIISRSLMAANLLLDEEPGMLDMMIESSYPGETGDKSVIGDEILATARKLKADFASAGESQI